MARRGIGSSGSRHRGDESTDEATFDEFVSTFEFVGTVVV
jgi:hypothetical protein